MMKVKVINKNKVGVTFKVLGLPSHYAAMSRQESTWDEFNENFELLPEEKFVYKLKDEVEKVIQEKNEFFSQLLPWMMSARVKKEKIDAGLSNDHAGWFADAGMLGGSLKRYQEKFGGAPIDFINEYKEYEKTIMETMMFNDIGVGSVHTKNHNFHEDKWSEDDREKVKKTLSRNDDDNGSMSLGDMLKGKGIDLKVKE
jgi:hypothetical protein